MKKALAVVVLALLALVACTPNQVLVTLEASVAATEALVVSLAATGTMDAVTAAEITAAIVGLPAAFQGTAQELATTDSAAMKYTKIALLYVPTLERIKGLPPTAQAYASAVAAAIQAFLNAIQPTTAMRAAPTSPSLLIDKYHNLGDRIFVLTDEIKAMQRK